VVVETAKEPPTNSETKEDSRMIVVSPPKLASTKLPDWIDEYQMQVKNARNQRNYITQDDNISLPAYNTRSKSRTTPSITQETLLACIEMSTTPLTPQNTAGRRFTLKLLCEMVGSVLDGTIGDLLEYRHLIRHPEYQEIWGNAFGKEIGRLAQGLPGVVEGTDTIDFIDKNEVPNNIYKDCTYVKIVESYGPEKADPNQIRITVGGGKIKYPGDCGTPTADRLTVKLLLNSVISTKDAKFMTLDIANFTYAPL